MSQIEPSGPERADRRPRLVIGVAGASGVAYGLRALAACRDLDV